jgi:hypothetical protein
MDLSKLTPAQKAQVMERLKAAGLVPDVNGTPVPMRTPEQRPTRPTSGDYIDVDVDDIAEAARANGASLPPSRPSRVPQEDPVSAPAAPKADDGIAYGALREKKWQANANAVSRQASSITPPQEGSLLRDTTVNFKRLSPRDKTNVLEDIDQALNDNEMLRRIVNPTDDDTVTRDRDDE